MVKQNKWDDEQHDEHVPDKTIVTQTSQNSKRTPTGGQKPMEWVGWWTMQWTHFLVTTTWTSWNSKRTPTGGHKPPEQVGWQIMWQTWSRRDENPHKRAQTSGMSRTMNGFPNEMTMIQTSWNSKRTPIWEHEPHKPPLPAHPHPSVNFLLKLSYLGFFFTFSLIFISFVSLFLCHLTLITFCYNLNYIFAISGLKFRHQVQVWPLPEPKSRTPGSDSGSNQVWEVHKLDRGQSIGNMRRVGDGNGVDGDDNCYRVFSGAECVDVGSAGGLCVVLVVLYKRDGKGSDVSDPSEIKRVVQIPSLRSWSRLEWQRSMLWVDRYTVPVEMPCVQLRLQRWYRWDT